MRVPLGGKTGVDELDKGRKCKMKPEESVVNLFLHQTQTGKIVYEPDGNIPPDFSIDARIGVEVRRLNQNSIIGGAPEDLDQLAIPLYSAINEVLRSFDPQYRGQSFLVGYDFERPIEPIHETKRILQDYLTRFLENNIPVPVENYVSDNLRIRIHSRLNHIGETFRIAGNMDNDWGGGVIEKYLSNVNLCLSEKSKKIKPYKSKYQEWWLALVDRTYLYPDGADLKVIKQNIIDLGTFTRLCIINPNDLGLVVDIRK